MDAFYASVELLRYPQLKGLPVVIGGGRRKVDDALLQHPDGSGPREPCFVPVSEFPLLKDYVGRGVITTATYPARQFGVGSAMGMMKAAKLCPQAIVLPVDFEEVRKYSRMFKNAITEIAPVMQDRGVDEVYIDFTDVPGGQREGGRVLARLIQKSIFDKTGLTCSIGVAPNRLLAKLASDMMKPDGLVILHAETLPDRLYDLALRDIAGIGAKMQRRLAREGINDIRQLCARRPRDAGNAWGGTNGDRLWYLLHGVDLPEKPSQSRTIGHSHVLSPGKRGLEPVRLTARRLALKAASRLRRKGHYCRLLVLHGKFEDDKSNWRASVKLPVTQDSFVILAALDALFPQLAAAGRGRAGGFQLRQVGVTLCEIEPVAGEQETLFAHLDPDDPLARETRGLALSRAMDTINEKFGRHAVSVGPIHGDRIDRVGTKIAFGRIPELHEFHE